MANSEVGPNGNGTPRYFVAVGQLDGLNVLEVFGVEDNQLVFLRTADIGPRNDFQQRPATRHDDAVRIFADCYGERLDVQLPRLKLTVISHCNKHSCHIEKLTIGRVSYLKYVSMRHYVLTTSVDIVVCFHTAMCLSC